VPFNNQHQSKIFITSNPCLSDFVKLLRDAPEKRKQVGYAALPPSTAAPTSLRTSALEHFEEINVFSSRDCSASTAASPGFL
jgi:hypothetical protein